MAVLPKKSVYIPHVVNQNILFRKARETDLFNILFLGTYNHPPNIVSLNFIIERILPLLAKKTEKFRFHIVGGGTEKFQDVVINSLVSDFVVIRGFEKDINRVFQNMDIALFPIQYGGGVKTKIIDAMAAGVPVVTTPEGILGLHSLPEDCIGVGKTATEILDEILLLMKNYSLRLTRSMTAKKYIEENYSFKIFSKKISDTYLKAVCRGEDVTKDKGETVVKAVTYHDFKFEKTPDGYMTRIVVDI